MIIQLHLVRHILKTNKRVPTGGILTNKILSLGAAIVIAFTVAYKMGLFNSDKKEIESLISQIEESLTLEQPIKPIAAGLRLKKIKKAFKPNFTYTLKLRNSEVYNSSGFQDVDPAAFSASKIISLHKMNRQETQINVNGEQAAVSFYTNSAGNKKDGNFNEIFTVALILEKIESKWLIQSISIEQE